MTLSRQQIEEIARYAAENDRPEVGWVSIEAPVAVALAALALQALDAGQPVATHRHKKRDTEYVLIGFGKMQSDKWIAKEEHLKAALGYYPKADMREVAIYRSVDDGSLWVRPREEFEDGRFDAIPSPSVPADKGEPVAPDAEWRERAYRLWKMLDDIDTLDDACKGDDAAFRKSAYAKQRERFNIVAGAELDALYADFYGSRAPAPASSVEALAPTTVEEIAQWQQDRAALSLPQERVEADADTIAQLVKERDEWRVVAERLADSIPKFDAKITAAEAEAATLRADKARMDWLVMQHVEVRTPLVYGSRANFHASPEQDEGDELPSKLRELVDAARARTQQHGAKE